MVRTLNSSIVLGYASMALSHDILVGAISLSAALERLHVSIHPNTHIL